MDAVARGRCFLLIGAAPFTVACVVPKGPPVGVSSPRAPDSVASPDGGRPSESPLPADYRSRMQRVTARFVSEGHGEGFEAVIWADGAAAEAWRSDGDMPGDAQLLEELTEHRAGGDRAAGVLVMTKRAGAWNFGAVGPEGDVASAAATLPCAECHRSAPRDEVFRVP